MAETSSGISVNAKAAASDHRSQLEVLHLEKSYGSRKVVKDVSLSVRKGEVVGLLGPNGAGKTTSFYMIVGLVRSDGGDIRIDGQSVANMPIHQRSQLGLSYLPQEASIFRKLSVQDNVRAVLELQKGPNGKPLPRDEVERQLTALLQELRVEHLRESPAVALSRTKKVAGPWLRVLMVKVAMISSLGCLLCRCSYNIKTKQPAQVLF